jgi:hypothetical protein
MESNFVRSRVTLLTDLHSLRIWSESVANHIGIEWPLVADLVHSMQRRPTLLEQGRRTAVNVAYLRVQDDDVDDDHDLVGGTAAQVAEWTAEIKALDKRRSERRLHVLAASSACRYILSMLSPDAAARLRLMPQYDGIIAASHLAQLWQLVADSCAEPGGAVQLQVTSNINFVGCRQRVNESVVQFAGRFNELREDAVSAGNQDVSEQIAALMFVIALLPAYVDFVNANRTRFINLVEAQFAAIHWTIRPPIYQQRPIAAAAMTGLSSGASSRSSSSAMSSLIDPASAVSAAPAQQPHYQGRRFAQRKSPGEWAKMGPWARYDWKISQGVPRAIPPPFPRNYEAARAQGVAHASNEPDAAFAWDDMDLST